MEVKELRIGNLVYYKGKIIKIAQLLADCAYNEHDFQSYRYDELEPIPLTEEWLLKFGFAKREDDDFTYFKKYDIEFSDVSPNGFELIWYELAPCKYVHQLQNIYFALTGEELEIK